MSRVLYLAPMSAGASIVMPHGQVLDRAAVAAASQAKFAKRAAVLAARDRAKVHPRRRTHLHGSVIERYLKWLRGGNDQRSEPGSPFGSEAE